MKKSQLVKSHVEIVSINPENINTVIDKCEKRVFSWIQLQL
jgi:hypothetical protein